MVGLFSRFSSSRNGHRHIQTSLNNIEAIAPNAEATTAAATVTHGIELAAEFKPLEHPTEPFDNDQPIQCPLPEPSILNDGRMWKVRASASVRMRSDLPAMQEGPAMESNSPAGPKLKPSSKRMILPSISAPEHNILKLLEECNASGI